jgi:predicted transcriptional regulator
MFGHPARQLAGLLATPALTCDNTRDDSSLTAYYRRSSFNPTCNRCPIEALSWVEEKVIRLTKFQLEVMQAVWEIGAGSVRDIKERLPGTRQRAYTTVQTIVRRLEEKGAVRRVKKIGKAFIFEPPSYARSVNRRIVSELLFCPKFRRSVYAG